MGKEHWGLKGVLRAHEALLAEDGVNVTKATGGKRGLEYLPEDIHQAMVATRKPMIYLVREELAIQKARGLIKERKTGSIRQNGTAGEKISDILKKLNTSLRCFVTSSRKPLGSGEFEALARLEETGVRVMEILSDGIFGRLPLLFRPEKEEMKYEYFTEAFNDIKHAEPERKEPLPPLTILFKILAEESDKYNGHGFITEPEIAKKFREARGRTDNDQYVHNLINNLAHELLKEGILLQRALPKTIKEYNAKQGFRLCWITKREQRKELHKKREAIRARCLGQTLVLSEEEGGGRQFQLWERSPENRLEYDKVAYQREWGYDERPVVKFLGDDEERMMVVAWEDLERTTIIK